MKGRFILVLILISSLSHAQQSFRTFIKSAITGEGLKGATIITPYEKRIAGEEGLVILTNLPPGKIAFSISFSGYQSLDTSFIIPDTTIHTILLDERKEDLQNVTVISSTRTNQKMENSPLKVEVLGREEMDEENNIKPGNIASVLGDVSGIQIQQSSPVSGNSNVRIQGLEGRYTQIMRDGMPLFEGFSGGFGILQIPPLDLKQIELIKGSASTLYGGGAIGGLINLISKRPNLKQEGEITLNATTLKETNLNTYIAKRNDHIGYNFFGGITNQDMVDVNGDGITDVPKLDAIVLHPRVFFYPSPGSSIAAGYTGTFEKRMGGDVLVLQGKGTALHQFYEENISDRHTGDIQMQFNTGGTTKVEVKGILSSFNRSIRTAKHYFNGNQLNYFGELSYVALLPKFSWVSGVNLSGDRFKILPSDPVLISNDIKKTVGIFTQFTANLGSASIIEAGLRMDKPDHYNSFILPRAAFFHRFNEQWATRLGIGFGYKLPDALAPQTKDYSIETIHPLLNDIKAETSVGYNAEINYKKQLDNETSIFINQAFFLTQLKDPIVAYELPNNTVQFYNAGKNITSKGFDTYVKATFDEIELYAGYTFTIAERNYLLHEKFVPLTPKNRFAFVATYEVEHQWRFGVEGSYTGSQHRYDYSLTPSYFFLAAVISRTIGDRWTAVLNCENLLDYRQSKHESLFTGSITDPVFKALWGPIDGRVINLSLRWQWANGSKKTAAN